MRNTSLWRGNGPWIGHQLLGPSAAAPTPKAASRGIEAAPSAAPAAEVTAQLIRGDCVKIIEGRYTGLIGQIVEIRVGGKFNRFTVRLPGDDQYYDVPNFPMFALEKA